MPQIINDPSFGSRLGEALGTGLGGGLQTGMQALANMKLQQLQDRMKGQYYKKALGYDDDRSTLLGMAKTPGEKAYLLQAFAAADQAGQQQPVAKQPESLSQRFESLGQQVNPLDAINQQAQTASAAQPRVNPYMSGILQSQMQGMRPEQAPIQQQPILQDQSQAQQAGQQQLPAGVTAQQMAMRKAMAAVPTNPMLAERQRHNLVTESAAARKEQNENYKISGKKIDEWAEKYHKAADIIQQNDETIALAKSGNLQSGPVRGWMERHNLGEWFLNPAEQVGRKQIHRQAMGFVEDFGSAKITGKEFDTYVKGKASLGNTPEAIQAILTEDNLSLRKKQLPYEAYEQVMQQNPNISARDLDLRVNAMVRKGEENLNQQAHNHILETIALANGKNVKIGSEAMDEKPPAAEWVGRSIVDPVKGVRWDSDGIHWKASKFVNSLTKAA